MAELVLELGETVAGVGVKTAYGDPVDIEGTKIVPVALGYYGFGAGSGSDQKGDQGSGGGGGRYGLDYFADPAGKQKGQVNHHFGGRGVYWADPDGHWLEIITRPYGSIA